MTKRTRWSALTLFLIAIGVIALDQYTKSLVRQHLPLHTSWNPIPWLEPIVTLTHTTNTGAAFGLFPQFGGAFVLIALAVVVVIIVYYRQLALGSWLLRLAFGLQLGGAVGNLIDRVSRGYVTDFIDFRVWPVFNVADSAIVVGTILLAYYALFLERGRREESQPAGEPQAGAPDAG